MNIDSQQTRSTWPDIHFMRAHLAHWIAQGFGSGLVPIFPGTAGTLASWFIYAVLMKHWPLIFTPLVWLGVIVAGFIIGVWACQRTANDLGKPDHGSIVWDEMVAFWLVLWLVMPAGFITQCAVFALFRFFDIVKPPPIADIDRCYTGGFGVMWDDIIAAFYCLLVYAFYRSF